MALGVAVVATMALSTVAFASEEWANYLDPFPNKAYNGSTGTLWWGDSPWIEVNDDGNVNAGAVHVDQDANCADGHKCLHLMSDGLVPKSVGAKRYADLSMFEKAELCFEVTTSGDLGLAVLSAYATSDGSSWELIYSSVQGVGEYAHPVIDVSEYISPEFGIKFEVSNLLLGEVFVDTVELKGLLVPEPSTTTTTKPTTTTTKPSTTSTTSSTTTTTRPTIPPSSSTTSSTIDRVTTTTNRDATTTTTQPTTTTTTTPAVAIGGGEPPEGGLFDTGTGVQADYQRDLFGGMEGDEVMGVELTAEYRMAVEAIEASWLWMLGLAVVIALAIISGIDRRRSRARTIAA